MAEDSVSSKQLEEEVHVWLVRPGDIDDATQRAAHFALLSESERARYERFSVDAHRRLFLSSHAMVRSVLSRYVAVTAQSWRFEQGSHGRPEIDPGQNAIGLRFNLSHTENLAACVVCLDRDCGVDVERLDRVKDLERVSKRVLTRTELDDLAGREGDDLQERFTDYWTLKEAYMKARGEGFRLPPRTFSVELEGSGAGRARLAFPADFDDEAAAWQLEFRALDRWEKPHYRLGIAVRTGPGRELATVVRPWLGDSQQANPGTG